jgi:putative ABC transport system substrate-binding protein
LFYGLRSQVMDLAFKGHLPAIWTWESFGGFGALLVYGPSDTENYHRAAAYVDRILKGAKPGDLPVEQPTEVKYGWGGVSGFPNNRV